MKHVRFFSLLAAGLLVRSAGAEVITTYDAGTVLENIATGADGNIYVSDLFSGTVFRVSPGGSSQVFGQAPGPLAGLALDANGAVIGVGASSVYRFAPDGTATLVTDVAGSGFLNGITPFGGGNFLVTDDTANTIWRVDANTGASSAWVSGGLLEPPAGGLPIGANGIKLYHGSVYVSNTGAATVVRIPILGDGSAGTPQVYASGMMIDDFAFGSDGSLFGATQVGELVRIRPDGTQTVVGTRADGLLGDAAVAFGRLAGDTANVYVVNNGGAFLGMPDGPEEARIVRLAVGVSGVTPESQVVPEPSSVLLTAIGLGWVVWIRRRRLPS